LLPSYFKYAGNGTHSCGLKYCDWKGYDPYPLFAKTTVKPSWCEGSVADCSASSSNCCSSNSELWQWMYNITDQVAPKWNFAGKHLFDRCGNHYKYVLLSIARNITWLRSATMADHPCFEFYDCAVMTSPSQPYTIIHHSWSFLDTSTMKQWIPIPWPLTLTS
jgi:hypothetical protein